jgi:hypothetical protein
MKASQLLSMLLESKNLQKTDLSESLLSSQTNANCVYVTFRDDTKKFNLKSGLYKDLTKLI